MRVSLPLAFTALVLAGCASPVAPASARGFVVVVHATGSADVTVVVNLTAGTDVVSRSFLAPHGQTTRQMIAPPASVFDVAVVARPATGGPTASVGEDRLDLARCTGRTIFAFDVSATSSSIQAGNQQARCEA